MLQRVVDEIADRAGESFPRRASLRVLGGAALAAAISPAGATAANGGKKDKKRCQRQREVCRASVVARCEGFTACEQALLPCCELLAQCNGAAAVACVLDAQEA